MKIKLAYGKTGLEIALPDEANVTVVEPKYVAGLPDEAHAMREALRRPIGSPPLKALVNPFHRVGVVFSDVTRPTPNALLLPILLGEIGHVPDEQIVLFNSTGTHRPNTEAELRRMLGDEIVERYRIVQNHATDRDSHTLVGTTHSGNEVWIHREFVACDVRISTGFIEPHFFAGFSGGGKAIMPGLALLETVMRNHSAANMDSPLARWGITHGNPLWEEVREAAAMAQPTFLLNVALNRDKQTTGVFAGDPEEAHARGCAFVKEKAMVPVPKAFDIVIASNSGYPLDLNLYQSVKGMSAAAQVVKEGGSIVIAADCWDGIPDHGEYGRLLRQAKSLESLLATLRAPGFQRQDMWQAHIQALICLKADVYFYSHNLSDEQIKGAFLKPCRDIEATVARLLQQHELEATVCVLPEGPQTIPYVHGE
ncbi:MAG: nickel-dependent lactate racemase [Anaerolineae bacterium]|nr:MAG: nickel-dependent lactate racemase [Anaerolineae bacterium]